MYPSTNFEIIDNSAIPSLNIVQDTTMYKVLEMAAFSSDKGPEDYREVVGSEFFSLYGTNIDFEKHGQPLLQSAMAINAGARLYAKRIVAKDSALANVGVVAVISPATKKTEVITDAKTANVYYSVIANEPEVSGTYKKRNETPSGATETKTLTLTFSATADDTFTQDQFDILKQYFGAKVTGNNPISNTAVSFTDFKDAYDSTFDHATITNEGTDVNLDEETAGSTLTLTYEVTTADPTPATDPEEEPAVDPNVQAVSVYTYDSKINMYNVVEKKYNVATNEFIDEEDPTTYDISVIDYRRGLNGFTDEATGNTYRPWILMTTVVSEAAQLQTITEDVFALHYKTISLEDVKYDANDDSENGYAFMENYKKHMNIVKEKFIQRAEELLLNGEGSFNDKYYVDILAEIANKGKISKEIYFPLFVIADNGRGLSNKTFKITPDYAGSKYYQFIKYQFEIQENGRTLETINFAIDPSTSYEGKNLSIETAFRDSKQLRCKQYINNLNAFINVVASLLGMSVSELRQNDILTLKNNKKKDLVSTNEVNLIYVDDTTNTDISFENETKYINPIPITVNSEKMTDITVKSYVKNKVVFENLSSINTVGCDVTNTIKVSHNTHYDDGTDKVDYYAMTVTGELDTSENLGTDVRAYTSTFHSINFEDVFNEDDLVTITTNIVLADGSAYDIEVNESDGNPLTVASIKELAQDTILMNSIDGTLWNKTVAEASESEVKLYNAIMKDRTITDHAFMEGGSNGLFGDAPIKVQFNSSTFSYNDVSAEELGKLSPEEYLDEVDHYNDRMEKVFTGYYDNCIYDLDNVKFDVIVDANYSFGITMPTALSDTDRYHDVKTAIQKLVTFREDALYMADLGLKLYSLESIESAFEKLSIKDKFTAVYHNSYDIIDPYSYKQITVTIGYNIARLLVNHFGTGRNKPFAGIKYGITIPDIIEGTINYVPVRIPGLNEKEALDDTRINYGSYYDGVFTIETLYTCQLNYTQFSFLNNILAIQEVIKAIRHHCPKIRYSFLDGNDLSFYKNEVQAIINKYAPSFLTITFEYVQDETYAQNKIFYGAIEVKFRNFVQSEFFKVTAIG